MIRRRTLLTTALIGIAALAARRGLRAEGVFAGPVLEEVESERARFRLRELARGLEHPWSLAFLPDGRLLVTERPGRLRLVERGRILSPPLAGVPEVWARGQGGLLDVRLDPAFADNRLVYLSYAAAGPDGRAGTRIGRGRLEEGRLADFEPIFTSNARTATGVHFGCRLLFDREGLLFATLGERGVRELAQDLSSHGGKTIRIRPDGSVPEDNPFVDRPGAMPEIWTLGHRNPQGMDMDPESGLVWVHEHGPQGGDEVNVLRKGANYGWPVVTLGREYGTGAPIGEGTHREGMEDPLWVWVPTSIAPSGMAFYAADAFPGWRGDLFVGALRAQSLVRLFRRGTQILGEERLIPGRIGRIRDVRIGPDGLLYLLTDHADGGLYRIEPA